VNSHGLVCGSSLLTNTKKLIKMEKLFRFTLLAIIFILLMIFTLLIIPSISWLFGGEFVSVLQSPAHLMPMIILGCTVWGAIFNDCFDENFNSK